MNLREISVIITTCNAAPQLARSLDKLSGFGEIVLVDAFSADETVDIARSHSAIIYSRPWLAAADQKNWALGRARHDWVLALESDEMVSDALKSELARADETDGVTGYWIIREHNYLGRPIGHCGGQAEGVLRLFRRSRGRYVEAEGHADITVDGTTLGLKNRLVHDPHGRLDQHIRHINERSTRRAGEIGETRFLWLEMVWRPFFRFCRDYFWKRGLLDGSRGLVFCLLSSYDEFLAYAKAWEIRRRV